VTIHQGTIFLGPLLLDGAECGFEMKLHRVAEEQGHGRAAAGEGKKACGGVVVKTAVLKGFCLVVLAKATVVLLVLGYGFQEGSINALWRILQSL